MTLRCAHYDDIILMTDILQIDKNIKIEIIQYIAKLLN